MNATTETEGVRCQTGMDVATIEGNRVVLSWDDETKTSTRLTLDQFRDLAFALREGTAFRNHRTNVGGFSVDSAEVHEWVHLRFHGRAHNYRCGILLDEAGRLKLADMAARVGHPTWKRHADLLEANQFADVRIHAAGLVLEGFLLSCDGEIFRVETERGDMVAFDCDQLESVEITAPYVPRSQVDAF